jgi:hypothetical protein
MPANRSISRRLSVVVRRAVLGASVLAASSACSRFHHSADEEPAMQAQIVFINESLEQADVFATSGAGESIRIGTVQAGRTQTLDVPQQFVTRASVIIVVRLLARSGTIRTGPIAISAGDRIQVRLPISGNVLSVLPAR